MPSDWDWFRAIDVAGGGIAATVAVIATRNLRYGNALIVVLGAVALTVAGVNLTRRLVNEHRRPERPVMVPVHEDPPLAPPALRMVPTRQAQDPERFWHEVRTWE